jgi:hypothetical protein
MCLIYVLTSLTQYLSFSQSGMGAEMVGVKWTIDRENENT